MIGKIDWERRFDNMQNHTCEHIFSGLVHQKYKLENVGFHMDPDDITVDFSGEIPMESIPELEQLVNQAITQDIDLKIEFPTEEALEAMEYRSKKELHGVVRIVTIPGCDRCACCVPTFVVPEKSECSRSWMRPNTEEEQEFVL